MHLDVVDLREFYGSPLGRVARRLIGRRILEIWPDAKGLNVLGLGYATPFLRVYLGEAERVVCAMPAAQGVLHWPQEGPSRTCLADECELPLPDESMDRVLVVHGIETVDSLRQHLRQIWRVLAPGGRVLFVVPNRRSLWASLESTPLGHGRPYSRTQLSVLLRQNLFAPVTWRQALFLPPINWMPVLRSAGFWEQIGETLWPRFSGVIVVEAAKQLYLQPAERSERRVRFGKRVGVPAQTARTLDRKGRSASANAVPKEVCS